MRPETNDTAYSPEDIKALVNNVSPSMRLTPRRAVMVLEAAQQNRELAQLRPEEHELEMVKDRLRCAKPTLLIRLQNIRTLAEELEQILSLDVAFQVRPLGDSLRMAEVQLEVAVGRAAGEAGLVAVID